MGRMVAEPAEAAGDHRPRILRRHRRNRRRCPPLPGRRPGDRRDARGLQPVLPVPHRQRPPLRERGHPRRGRRRLLRRLPRRPRVQPLARAQRHRPRIRGHLRSVRQRRAHGHGRGHGGQDHSSSSAAARSASRPSRSARRPALPWCWSARSCPSAGNWP